MDEQKVFTTAAAAASMKSNANGPRLVDGWPNYTEDGIEREREREREIRSSSRIAVARLNELAKTRETAASSLEWPVLPVSP
jgi:hypothetical protein